MEEEIEVVEMVVVEKGGEEENGEEVVVMEVKRLRGRGSVG